MNPALYCHHLPEGEALGAYLVLVMTSAESRPRRIMPLVITRHGPNEMQIVLPDRAFSWAEGRRRSS